jgi:hypothetical protein
MKPISGLFRIKESKSLKLIPMDVRQAPHWRTSWWIPYEKNSVGSFWDHRTTAAYMSSSDPNLQSRRPKKWRLHGDSSGLYGTARIDFFTFATFAGVATTWACPARPSQNVPCCPGRHSTTAVSETNILQWISGLDNPRHQGSEWQLAGPVRMYSASGTPAFNGGTLSSFALNARSIAQLIVDYWCDMHTVIWSPATGRVH